MSHPVRYSPSLPTLQGAVPCERISERDGATPTPGPTPIYALPPTGHRQLRVGLLLEGLRQPAWVGRVIDAIQSSGAGEICLVIRFRAPGTAASNNRQPGQSTAPQFLSSLYRLVDRVLDSQQGPDPWTLVDASPWLRNVENLEVSALTGESGFRLPAEQAEAIQRRGLDVILAIGGPRWTGDILSAARQGLWRQGTDGGLGGMAEKDQLRDLLGGCPTIASELRMLASPPEQDRILCRSRVAAHERSLQQNRRRLAEASIQLAPRALRWLQREEPAAFAERSLAPLPLEGRPSQGRPYDVRMLRFLGSCAFRSIAFRLRGRRHSQWFLALRRRPPEREPAARDAVLDLHGFQPLPVPAEHFHADPFLIEAGGETHLFFEDFVRAEGKGVISHCRLSEAGIPSSSRTVLSRPYHLSYPFVFRWQGQFYMLPETAQNQTIELYRAAAFPEEWKLELMLLEGWRATDATLHEDEKGRWWMFVTIDERRDGSSDELFLFQAPSPLGPWRPHPANPIQSDICYARPAGRLLRRQGRLLRPAQDGSRHYGGALWLMEVLELTPERYRERPLCRLEPEWLRDNFCLHHLDATARFEVIDGMRRRPTKGG